MASTMTSTTNVSGVTRIYRPGVGDVYRAIVPIEELYRNLRDSKLLYAPKYQRGFERKLLDSVTKADYERLLPIYDPSLQINAKRAEAMATKYLMGLVGADNKRLFAADVIWNARRDTSRADGGVVFNEQDMTLEIRTVLTIPDSGHRHLAYYLLGRWKDHPEEIPREVDVDASPVAGDDIAKWLKKIDFADHRKFSVYAEIFNLDPEEEGWLYDEFNADAKPPSRAVALDLNQQKTPTRRFVYRLIESCPIFGLDEVETRSNTIGSKSRKLTTNSTMEAAIKPFEAKLARLEKQTGEYDDLVEFFCAFYTEWSNHYPEFKPGAPAEDRQDLRNASLAIANIMFFPMFRLAFELWESYKAEAKDWRTTSEWKDALGKLAGKVTETDPYDTTQTVTIDLMDRDNPAWHGKILIRTFHQDGTPKDWSLSSTSQTRAAAYHYLRDKAGLSRLA